MPAPSAMQSWVEREFQIEGILAAGGGSGGDEVFVAFAGAEMVMAGQEQVWQTIAGGVAKVRGTGAPAGELLWGFENVVLYTIAREDGSWIGVFMVPQLTDESALRLRAKLDEFKQLDFP